VLANLNCFCQDSEDKTIWEYWCEWDVDEEKFTYERNGKRTINVEENHKPNE